MQTKRNRRLVAFRSCMALFVAMALFTAACSGGTKKEEPSVKQEAAATAQDGDVLGQGAVSVPLTIVDKDGNETALTIHTDLETVGAALLDLGLIAGEDGEFGLYVKTVNGITADYDTDGVYWAFYVNGEYASTGVDSTPITQGDAYSLKVE